MAFRGCSPEVSVQIDHIRYGSHKIIKYYLLALPWWRADARDWHTLTDSNARFFNEMAGKLFMMVRCYQIGFFVDIILRHL